MLSEQNKSIVEPLQSFCRLSFAHGDLVRSLGYSFGYGVSLRGQLEQKGGFYRSPTKHLFKKKVSDMTSGSEKWLA